MRHILALIIKTIMVAAVLFVFFNMLNEYPVGRTFTLSLLVVGLAYLLGDLAILPMSNNTVATLADIGLATLAIWLLGPFVLGITVPFSLALMSSVVIGIGEWFFHKYIERSVLPRKEAV